VANLVSLVMQFLTPDMIGRIAAALGLDRNMVQSAITAAVPALLAGLTGTAAKPGGAQSLVDAIKQQSGILDSFTKTLGSGGQSSLIDTGSRLLTSLLGGQDQSALRGRWPNFRVSIRVPVVHCSGCWPRLLWGLLASTSVQVT
jgi:hypothetical protein